MNILIAGFKTDTGISGHTGQSRERVLQKWSADDDDAATASPTTLSLDSRGGAKKWDQFETNERLFGVDTDFNEEDYTTKLDRSDPRFREKEARAAKLARDIEGSASGNAHIAEERGQKVASEMDEETRYSSVIRDETKYVPPGVRKLAGDQQGASAASNSNGSARGGSAPMWSQVLGGQKNGNGAAPTTKATEKTPAVAVKNDASPANGNANKQPVTTAPAAQQPATTTAKQHQEPEGKKGPAPSAQSTTAAQQERQQASHRIAAAALDREKMQRRLQQENFMRFSQEINSKVFLLFGLHVGKMST